MAAPDWERDSSVTESLDSICSTRWANASRSAAKARVWTNSQADAVHATNMSEISTQNDLSELPEDDLVTAGFAGPAGLDVLVPAVGFLVLVCVLGRISSRSGIMRMSSDIGILLMPRLGCSFYMRAMIANSQQLPVAIENINVIFI